MTIQQKVPDIVKVDINAMREYFLEAWELNELLFSAIKHDSSYYLKPDPLRNPLLFYYGHTAAFYINKLVLCGLLEEGLNEHYEIIFARGVDPANAEELNDLSQWPEVDQVRAYRKRVKEVVLSQISEMPTNERVSEESPYWALHMAIEHARIHFETSSVLIRQLDVALLERPASWKYAESNGLPEAVEWVHFPDSTVVLGRPSNTDTFGWDNEYGSKTVYAPAFALTKNLVTNYEYLAFVSTGYNDLKNWTQKGKEWKRESGSQHPKFWVKDGEAFMYRAMFDLMEMPMDWPVEVNAYEAEAYCNWIGDQTRLPSEAEFNIAARMNERPDPCLESWPNLNMQFGSPNAVGAVSDPYSRINDLYGNVWDWLRDNFEALPGFKPHPYYMDFSLPYFDADHAMLLGGSWSTTGESASKYYRLWFRRFFYQHAGFRLSKSVNA